jgi:hypothetical protein
VASREILRLRAGLGVAQDANAWGVEFLLRQQHVQKNRSAQLPGHHLFIARKAPQFANTAEHEADAQPIVRNGAFGAVGTLS